MAAKNASIRRSSAFGQEMAAPAVGFAGKHSSTTSEGNEMRIVIFALLVALCVPRAVQAAPIGGRMLILSMRPYIGGSIYLAVSSKDLCGTEVFSFMGGDVNGKEMYAAALTAMVAGKEVQLEVSAATGCTGWGTRLQSIFIYG